MSLCEIVYVSVNSCLRACRCVFWYKVICVCGRVGLHVCICVSMHVGMWVQVYESIFGVCADVCAGVWDCVNV